MDLPSLLLLLLLMFASTINAQFPATYCGSTGNFTANSTYQTTLSTLLSSISTTNSSSLSYGFFNASGAVSGTSQTLYVFGLCRGDLTAVGCRACLNVLTSDARRLCPLQKEALLYTGNCIIRYSDTSLFGTVVTKPSYLASTTDNVSSPDAYDAAMRKLLNVLLAEAARGGSLRKYASGNELVGPDMIYALVQCTPDLTEQQCSDCLVIGVQEIRGCCVRYTGGRFMVPSCLILYETNHRFFDPVSEPPSPSQGGDVLPPSPGKRHENPNEISSTSSKGTLVVIVVSVVVFLLLLFVGCCYLRRMRAQKKYKAAQEESGVSEIASLKSLQFDWDVLVAATNNFSQENKLGEGGFGEVYQVR
ncbi:hypothetical protein BT93_E2489 [Corymbia citriodora subsp. variegata]|nr:hypothetical protein BT93_E2489 [Corymbia citriodora subsp. variegata]